MFSERLKKLRVEKRITQLVLAELLGISQQAVGKWETGKATPDPLMLKKIADIFGVSSDYLLGRDVGCPKGWTAADETQIPVLEDVRAEYGALVLEAEHPFETANKSYLVDYFYLIIQDNSMEPYIHSGDLALVHKQSEVESGELAVVLVAGKSTGVRRVVKKNNAVILQPFHPSWEAQIFIGDELHDLQIIGRVVETKTKW